MCFTFCFNESFRGERVATLSESERGESAVVPVRHFREGRLYGLFRSGTIPIKSLTHPDVGLQKSRELFHACGVCSCFRPSEPVLCQSHLAEKLFCCRLSCKEESRSFPALLCLSPPERP